MSSRGSGTLSSARICPWNLDLRFPEVERKLYKAMSAFCRVFVGLLLSMQRSEASPCAQPLRAALRVGQRNFRRQHGGFVPVKRHRGEPGHTRDTLIKSQPRTGHTGHTGARGHTDHTDEPHNHPPKPNDTPADPHDHATAETATDSTSRHAPPGISLLE